MTMGTFKFVEREEEEFFFVQLLSSSSMITTAKNNVFKAQFCPFCRHDILILVVFPNL